MRPLMFVAALSLAAPALGRVATAGYLDGAARPDLAVILPGPPAAGSPRALADAAIFRESRAMAGSARWRIDRLGADRSAMIGAAKAHWQSPRPFVGSDAPICEPRRPDLIANGDYP